MNPQEIKLAWKPLGDVAKPDALWESRVQTHWALQIVAAVGRQLVPEQPDFGHTNLGWLDERRALASNWAEPEPYVSAALRFPDFTLLLDTDEATPDMPLTGKTQAEGYAWLRTNIEALGGKLPGEIGRYDNMPGHAVAAGDTPFNPDPATMEELARWFDNADRLLHLVEASTDGAGPVRAWPHHLDLATLIQLDPADASKAIGIGMTPGDAGDKAPYYYCNPYPAPAGTSNLPALAGGGTWHTQGWTGAVLTAEAIVAAGDASAQAEAVLAWTESALGACKAIVTGG